ncbi:hypothetical protein GBF38_007441, partial [Nibea albiflora]
REVSRPSRAKLSSLLVNLTGPGLYTVKEDSDDRDYSKKAAPSRVGGDKKGM